MGKKRRKSKKRSNLTKLTSIAVVGMAFLAATCIQYIKENRSIGQAITQTAIETKELLGQVASNKPYREKIAQTSANEQIPPGMELPKRRTSDTRILTRKGYTLSYNDEWRIPNWVAWELTPEETRGQVKRSDNFETDPDLPTGVLSEHRDYSSSGYDRGHMAPAADMKWSEEAMVESFYMSNICPQAPNLNQGEWRELEDRCRELVQKQHTSLYIVCGPIVKEGKRHKRIGKKNKVTVPDGFFKVVMKLGQQPSAVGFIFPNDDCNEPYENYTVSIDSVEAVTGIDFFHQLPDEQENRLEAQNNLKW